MTPAKKTDQMPLVEQVGQMPPAVKAGLVAGGVVLAGIIFGLLAYMPYAKEKARLEAAISTAANELSAQEAILEKHQPLGRMKEGIDWSYEYMQQYLPQENEMPGLVRMVSEIGAKAGLNDGVTLFAPKLPAKVRPDYAEIPFTMKLQGEFNTVLSFLYDFSRMNRIVNITEVNIGSPKMVDANREILHITVDCSGSTYRSLTEAETAERDDSAEGRS